MARLWMSIGFSVAVLSLCALAGAADFEIVPQSVDSTPGVLTSDQVRAADAQPSQDARAVQSGGLVTDDVPVWLQAGDVPTAYTLAREDLKTDLRFYQGGGVLGQAYYGLFSRVFVGLSGNVPGFVGPGSLVLKRNDAQALGRVALLTEDGAVPALAVGWDASSYEDVQSKGLYVAASKEILIHPCFVQVHAGVDSGDQLSSFQAKNDLRGFAALTASLEAWGAFTSVDQVLDPFGPRWCVGVQGSFGAFTVGLEFQDLASVRPGASVARLLRLSWNGNL